jgi:hypothetical protein
VAQEFFKQQELNGDVGNAIINKNYDFDSSSDDD